MNWQPSKCLESPKEFRQYLDQSATSAGQEGQGHGQGMGQYALIILNQPILIRRDLFENVWHNATYRFCADGGGNRLYDLLKTDEERAKFLPGCIHGDLDSLRDSVKNYYTSMGVPVVKNGSEDSTDFMKCVELVRKMDPTVQTLSASASGPSSTSGSTNSIISDAETTQHQARLRSQNLGIVALGGTGGRFDQSMSSIHHLYILNRERYAVLISDESIVIVLDAGHHEITCNHDLEGPTCGIIPVGSSEASLTTTGLKWDIENWKTSFGTQISTSNALVDTHITLHTTAPVVWTTELRSCT